MVIDQRRWRVGVAALVVAALMPPAAAQSPDPAPRPAGGALFARSPQYPLLPRELETELALSAAPPHVRAGATVALLESSGYVTATRGANAFTCLVSRRGGDLFPVCWDAEGTRSLYPLDVDDAQLRLKGKAGTEIEQLLASGFADGRHHPPSRTGIAHMLSPLRPGSTAGSRGRMNPHVMFCGPNLTDADIGGLRGSVVFMNKVGPDGMIIVPVGQKEKEAILAESRSLTERLERAIGYSSPQP
jgi:hypothetical protein